MWKRFVKLRPEIRNKKLGVKFSKLQTLFYDKEFRHDYIHTLATQIYESDLMNKERWRVVITEAWKVRSEKNRFVDTAQLKRRPNLCKMGCVRVTNPNERNGGDKVYDTCCSNCAKGNMRDENGKLKKGV